MEKSAAPTTIDGYIDAFPAEVQSILQEMRAAIRSVIPDAEEAIAYGIPTFRLSGRNVVHFGGFKKHIGFYPTPSGAEQFKEALAAYPGSKGTVQFPLDRPIPYDLVREITAFRAEEARQKARGKKKN
jgi:uncharacterized protein YdhG (YjbR/CyaY superfamily)